MLQPGTLSRLELATILGIPSHLVREIGREHEHDGDLHMSYLKYQTAIQAVATQARMIKDGEWQGKKLAELEVIDLVISKSMWYSHYRMMFPKVSQSYPDMLGWLKETADAPDDFEIWGMEKGTYTFSDLVKWLQEKDKEKGRKGKGPGRKDKKDDIGKNEDEEKKSKKKRRN